MPDFFVQKPEDTTFKLRDDENKVIGTVDAIDVIDMLQVSRGLAEKAGNTDNWYIYFSKSFLDLTGVKLSKTSAVMLINESNKIFDTLKKNGSKELEQSDTPTPESTTQNET